MVTIKTDGLLSLSEAAKLLPTRPNISTIFRWCLEGCKGVKLEYCRSGRQMFTTKLALEQFCEKLTELDGQQRDARRARRAEAKPPTNRQREAAKRRADRVLDKAGI